MREKWSSVVEVAGLGQTERAVLSSLAALERPTVGADDVVRQLGVTRQAADLTLSRLARKGWLTRLRRGAYAVVPLSSTTTQPVLERAAGERLRFELDGHEAGRKIAAVSRGRNTRRSRATGPVGSRVSTP